MTHPSLGQSLSHINFASAVSFVQQANLVLLVSNELNVKDASRSLPGAAVHAIDPSSQVDSFLKAHVDTKHIDLMWIKSSDVFGTIKTADETMKRARFVVIELGSSALNSGGAIDLSRNGLIRRVAGLTRWHKLLGFDSSGTLVLQNTRANIVRRFPKPDFPPPCLVQSEPPPPPPAPPPPPPTQPTPTVTHTKLTQKAAPPVVRTNPVITMERLGLFGQWGKQVVQYAFVRSYAKTNKIDCEVPQWAGRYLFSFNDPEPGQHISPVLEETAVGQHAVWGRRLPPKGKEFINHDFIGLAQFDTAYYCPNKEFIQSLYSKPAEPQRSRVMLALNKLRKRGRTLIGLHLRRGDSGRTVYPLTPIGWCLRWLHTNWDRFDKPVLYIATEDPSLKTHFQGYDAVLAEDIGIHYVSVPYPGHVPYWTIPGRLRSIDFFPDWFMLQQSDVVLASNSMFSMSAAWTSTTNKETWRPKLSLQDFEMVDPWNMRDFVNHEHLDDYPGIPGTQIDDNPGCGWMDFHPTYPSVPESPKSFAQWMAPPTKDKP